MIIDGEVQGEGFVVVAVLPRSLRTAQKATVRSLESQYTQKKSRTSSSLEQNFPVSIKSVMLLHSVHNSKSNGPQMSSRFRCEMPPRGSCVYQRVVKFREVTEPLGVLVEGRGC